MTCPETEKPCVHQCPTACIVRMAAINPGGAFVKAVGFDPVNGVVGGYPAGNGPECPKCSSRDTEATHRDMVWEETTCRCNACGHTFIKP